MVFINHGHHSPHSSSRHFISNPDHTAQFWRVNYLHHHTNTCDPSSLSNSSIGVSIVLCCPNWSRAIIEPSLSRIVSLLAVMVWVGVDLVMQLLEIVDDRKAYSFVMRWNRLDPCLIGNDQYLPYCSRDCIRYTKSTSRQTRAQSTFQSLTALINHSSTIFINTRHLNHSHQT